MSINCPFCGIENTTDPDQLIAFDDLSVCIADRFPVSNGHVLILPKRHVSSFFDINKQERASLFDLLDVAKAKIDNLYSPDSYNIGINDGTAAGQTIPHLHIHLIPRYTDQSLDPKGGIRWVIPEKADYWSKVSNA